MRRRERRLQHDVELEALRGVEGHEDHPVVAAQFVGIGDERHLLQELIDAGELAGRTDELTEVLDPAMGFDGVGLLEVGEVTRALEHRLQHVTGTEIVGLGLRNMIAVATADAVLVADMSRAQDVKLGSKLHIRLHEGVLYARTEKG